MTEFDPIAVTLRVTRLLERLDVPYLIGGSMASVVHGEPRLTIDADIVARLEVAHIDALVEDLGSNFYVDAEAARAAIRARDHFNMIHQPSMFKVDVFIPSGSAFDAEQMGRRRRVALSGDADSEAFVASAEDTVLSKLVWYRDGGQVSDRQWRDILGVLKVSAAALDASYIERWAARVGVEELLHRARLEAGLRVD